MDYCDIIWGNCAQKVKSRIQILQNRAARIILGADKRTSVTSMHYQLKWRTLEYRRQFHKSVLVHKSIRKCSPPYLCTMFDKVQDSHTYLTRGSTHGNVKLTAPKTDYGKRTFSFSGASQWNKLPLVLREMDIDCFKRHYHKFAS